MEAQINNWQYKDQHVDSTIDESQFTSSARVVIYSSAVDPSTQRESEFFPIGVVQAWSWAEQRQIEQIFEIGSEINYLIPGRTMGQISISRILLFGKDIVNTLHRTSMAEPTNTTWIKSLKDITTPFNLVFAAFGNSSGTTSASTNYSRLFRRCWITSRSEQVNAQGIIIAEQASILYQDIPNVTFKTA